MIVLVISYGQHISLLPSQQQSQCREAYKRPLRFINMTCFVSQLILITSDRFWNKGFREGVKATGKFSYTKAAFNVEDDEYCKVIEVHNIITCVVELLCSHSCPLHTPLPPDNVMLWTSGVMNGTRGHMVNGIQALLYAVGDIITQVVTHPE